jgi:hypothetical protein
MARIVALEAIGDLLAGDLDEHRPAMRAGIGVLTVIERRQQLDN